MSLNYTSWLNQVANLMAIPSTDANLQINIPGAIDYAEQRMYRELDLLVTQVTDTGTTVASNRDANLPTTLGTYVVVDEVSIFSSAGTTASNGSRVTLYPTSKEYINFAYSNIASSNLGTPQYFCRQNQTQIRFGPTPDGAYTFEVVGTQRPTPLSTSNSTTFLTAYLPDLFEAATMIYFAGYMRNYGAQSDDPRMATSWSEQYDKLFASANLEEARKKFAAEGWSAKQPSPAATPPRV